MALVWPCLAVSLGIRFSFVCRHIIAIDILARSLIPPDPPGSASVSCGKLRLDPPRQPYTSNTNRRSPSPCPPIPMEMDLQQGDVQYDSHCLDGDGIRGSASSSDDGGEGDYAESGDVSCKAVPSRVRSAGGDRARQEDEESTDEDPMNGS